MKLAPNGDIFLAESGRDRSSRAARDRARQAAQRYASLPRLPSGLSASPSPAGTRPGMGLCRFDGRAGAISLSRRRHQSARSRERDDRARSAARRPLDARCRWRRPTVSTFSSLSARAGISRKEPEPSRPRRHPRTGSRWRQPACAGVGLAQSRRARLRSGRTKRSGPRSTSAIGLGDNLPPDYVTHIAAGRLLRLAEFL